MSESILQTSIGWGAILGATYGIPAVYEKLKSPTAQQYKSLVFLGALLLSLATQGFPYIEYDAATKVPATQFAISALTILIVFGSIFVYIMNMPLDTYIAYVSTFVIAFTMYSRLKERVGAPEFPQAAKDLLLTGVIAGVLFGVSKGLSAFQISDPTLQSYLVMFRGAVPIALSGLGVYAIYLVIRWMLEYRAERKKCPTGKRLVGGRLVATLEGFQDPVAGLVDQLKAAIERTQTAFETLVELTDSTCAIIREVEQGYVGARSGPATEAETRLSPEQQSARRDARIAQATKSFAESRRVYAKGRGAKPLECFQSSESEATLRELCTQLHTLLKNAQIQTVQTINVELDYASRLLKKTGLEGFQSEMETDTGTEATQFYSTLSGPDLITAANNLLKEEQQFQSDLQSVLSKTDVVSQEINKVYKKANMVATGNYNPNSVQNVEADFRFSTVKMPGQT